MSTTDETLAAWRRSVARVTLHPAWPIPIELSVTSHSRGSAQVQCVVHARDASLVLVDLPLPLAPWANLPTICVLFSREAPDVDASDAPDCEEARMRHVRERVREAVLHEIDEFLLVDGRIAASPHEMTRPVFAPMPVVRYDEISTWLAAIARVSLHPASRLQVELGVDADLWGHATIRCAVRGSDPALAATDALPAQNGDHVDRLLALVRRTALRLLDECMFMA